VRSITVAQDKYQRPNTRNMPERRNRLILTFTDGRTLPITNGSREDYKTAAANARRLVAHMNFALGAKSAITAEPLHTREIVFPPGWMC
jgi:hypothetical protein